LILCIHIRLWFFTQLIVDICLPKCYIVPYRSIRLLINSLAQITYTVILSCLTIMPHVIVITNYLYCLSWRIINRRLITEFTRRWFFNHQLLWIIYAPEIACLKKYAWLEMIIFKSSSFCICSNIFMTFWKDHCWKMPILINVVLN